MLAQIEALDWTGQNQEDRAANESAVNRRGDRVFSVHHDPKGVAFWIITEADRSVTTVLLPEDY